MLLLIMVQMIDSFRGSTYHTCMIKAGIIGATGYAGEEIVRLLTGHPEVEIKYLSSRTYQGEPFTDIFSQFNTLLSDRCVSMDIAEMADSCDVIFLALPHGLTFSQVTEDILLKTVIIDLGADFRLKNEDVYEKWYGVKHTNTKILKQAVYGLCELNRIEIAASRLIANPGCYTTCSILSLAPLLAEKRINPSSIIIDAKSGISGAGRSLSRGVHYAECNESVKAYKAASHRHAPEIEQELSILAGEDVMLTFTPHLIPMNRGILTTSYASLKKSTSLDDLFYLYKNFYRNEHFVRILDPGKLPETRFVRSSNFIDIGFALDERLNRVIIVGAIDNLIKGAAGQAVQNMNILFGYPEEEGLTAIPAVL